MTSRTPATTDGVAVTLGALREATDSLGAFIGQCYAAYPMPTVVVLGILAVLVLSRIATWVSTPRGRGIKDPTRMFTAAQRAEGFTRAGNRCEMEIMPFIRCRRPAHHGDHHIPWSKGGATSLDNFVAGCVTCNTSKGAKMPSAWSTMRLQGRRRRYFPDGLDVHAGRVFVQT
ncbi:HNH endonuclease [Tersicoccus sp. MR15.9]|uniref:HNH endonuclease n=1 Tax=Tersicoccus mangrovi TaxID=3121635 RepID=UPI002FE6C0A1